MWGLILTKDAIRSTKLQGWRSGLRSGFIALLISMRSSTAPQMRWRPGEAGSCVSFAIHGWGMLLKAVKSSAQLSHACMQCMQRRLVVALSRCHVTHAGVWPCWLTCSMPGWRTSRWGVAQLARLRPACWVGDYC